MHPLLPLPSGESAPVYPWVDVDKWYHIDTIRWEVASAMPAIHIRELSRSTLDRLKARARRHDRSLQAELKSILEEAAETDWSGTRALAAKLRKSLAGRTHSDSAELIASDRRSR